MRGGLLFRGAHASRAAAASGSRRRTMFGEDAEHHTRDAYAPQNVADRSILVRLILRAIADLEPVAGRIFEEYCVGGLGVFMAGTFDISRTDLPEHLCDFIDFGHT
jgi:hypothetical protein